VESQVVQGDSLHYVLVTPEGFRPGTMPLVVLLHGFGANMYDLAGLAPAIDQAGYAYAFPNAPYRVQLGPGMVGYSWMTGRPGMEPVPAGGPSVEEMLDGFMAGVTQQTGAASGSIVLGGFSQGGGLTLAYGLPRPEVFRGLAVLSGFFRDPDGVRSRVMPGDQRPVFVAHGSNDGVVPVDGGRNTRAFLEELGYPLTYREYPMAHEICQPELNDLVSWLHTTLPPGA
jgi:phospholipase/carboxylesterase